MRERYIDMPAAVKLQNTAVVHMTYTVCLNLFAVIPRAFGQVRDTLETNMIPKVLYRPSLSSLRLQVALYYNVIFSILFAVIIGACSINKITYYNKRVSISVLVIWTVLEPVRLYYGIAGNLKEKVPDLATYLLISLFPQLPFILYLAYIQPVIFPVDPILGSFMLIFLVFEIGFGFCTMRQIIRNQTAQFMRLCEEDEDD